ncbi:alpha/beta fold hydrolase [Fusibacter sp. JL298sf-3]
MAVIFLHGLGQRASSWEATIRELSIGGESYCPDFVDLLHDKPYIYSNLYKAFDSYCETFTEPLTLCGLSLGGVVALQYAIENPEKVKALILIGTPIEMPKKVLKLQNAVFKLMPKRAFENRGISKTAVIELCRSMMALNFRNDLNRLNCDVCIVCGEKDRANRKSALQLEAAIEQAKVVFVKGAGHEVNVDAPEKLAELLVPHIVYN